VNRGGLAANLLLLICHHTMPSCILQISNLVQRVSDAKLDPLDALCSRAAVARQSAQSSTWTTSCSMKGYRTGQLTLGIASTQRCESF